MDKRNTTAPEITNKESAKKGRFARFIAKLTASYNRKRLLKKWSHHADPRSLDWDWSKTHYNRIAVVNLLLSHFDNPAYLEIGCHLNTLFDSVPTMNKIGVDPSSGGNTRLTSDEFFKINNDRFDVVFIDGLHTYEQARRDIINSINTLNPGGWIAVHDMLPSNWIEQHVPIITNKAWTGDVWKTAFELKDTDGIQFKIIKIDYGVGVIKVIDPNVTLKDSTSVLQNQEFSYYYDNLEKLPIIEWDAALKWLRS